MLSGQPEEQDIAEERELFKLIATRRGKLGALTRKRNEVNKLIEAGQDKETVMKQIDLFDGSLAEFMSLQVSVQSLLKDECEREADHVDWYEPKLLYLKKFLEGVNKWATEEAHIADDEKVAERSVDHESASQTAQNAMCGRNVTSALSDRSSVSRECNAHLEAEAECAALKATASILSDKLDLDIEEAKLKARRERLSIDSKLAAAEAKVRIYREAEQRSVSGVYRYGTPTEYNAPVTVPRPVRVQRANSASETGTRQPIEQNVNQSPNTGHHNVTDVLKRQTEITEMLVKQQSLCLLPTREIPIYDGDPLQYRTFIKAFEQCVENKTSNMNDRLYYLQQYTRGQPRSLVSSFLHMDPTKAYKEAKEQLELNFGNGYKIASAYMNKALNWPVIKPEDGNGLRSYALFLRSCYNTMQDIDGLNELENSTNLRLIVSKLPFRLRDKWRENVGIIQDHNKHRATYKDLLEFVEKQSRAMLDPIFGDVHSQIDNNGVSKPKPQNHIIKPSGRTSFATTVAHVSELRKDKLNPSHKQKTINCAFERPCLFCEKNHTFERCEMFKNKSNSKKIDFMKENGMCFGCLMRGHVSKTCKARLKCEKCSLLHPTILHIYTRKEEEGRNTDHVITEKKPLSSAMVSVEDGDLMGVSESKQCTLAIVAVKVKVSNSDKVIHTYAFLDPGSSATFCTDSLKRKLNIQGKNTTILLCTMGQKKTVHSSVVSGLEVSNMEGLMYHKLPEVYTQNKTTSLKTAYTNTEIN